MESIEWAVAHSASPSLRYAKRMRWMILIFCAGLLAFPAGLASHLLEKEPPAYGIVEENGPRHAFSKPWIPNPNLIAKKEGGAIAIVASGEEVPDGERDFPEYFGALSGAGTAFAALALTGLVTSMGATGYYISFRYWPWLLAIGTMIGFLCSWSDRVRRGATRAHIKAR